MIQEALPVTLLINVLSLSLIIAMALPLGVISALTQNKLPDRSITIFVFIGFAIPSFWLALMLMYWTGVSHNWLPISGLHSLGAEKMPWLAQWIDGLKHLTLPILISGLTGLAGISLFVRNGMLDVLHQDYITTARAKGLTENTVVYKHALRNALLPLITIFGLSRPHWRLRDCRIHLCDSRHGQAFLRCSADARFSGDYGYSHHRFSTHANRQPIS
jgi:peptide/nickel transport system permease protein